MSQMMTQSTDELRSRKVELVLQQLESLPTLPAIAVRLLHLTGNSEAKLQEVVQLISVDPALTSKVLSLVQSAATGARQSVTSVRQAVVMLGYETIRNMVLSVKVFEIFQQEEGGGTTSHFQRAEFWKHSLAVATAAEMLAVRTKGQVNQHDAFVCGLLHDLGKIAFDTVMPKSFDRVVEVATLTRGDIADAERRIIGLDHAVAGKRMAEAWNLPMLITQAIWMHGAAPMTVPAGLVSPAMVRVVGLADLLVRRQHIGFSGNFLYPFDVRQYVQAVGLSERDADEVTAQLAENLEARAKALGLYDVQSRQLYLESIANANAELGRVNSVLATQNRKLALRSQCFEMLTKFHQRVLPSASPAQLLAEIGHVAHQFLEADKLVLFSQDPDQRAGEVLTFDAAQTTQDSFLMQMPPHGGDQRVGRSDAQFIRPACPQCDWLMERVEAFLTTRRCLFLPVLCGTQPIGGIIWQPREGAQALAGNTDLVLVSESWGMTLRMAQVREQQNILTEALANSNRDLASLQQQLVRAKSLAQLGEMAAGAAHEMNNPLAVVCGRAQLLASKLSEAALKQDALLIAQQGERLSQIITDLMDFAKPAAPRIASTSLPDLVDGAVADATQRAALATPIHVRVEPSGDMPPVSVDARQVRAAVSEVVLNALQATIAAQGRAPAPTEVLIQIRYDTLDEQAIVQVSDHGVGMSEETMKQAFAPFFSAKTAGRNRGMGLPKALRWVELHGGTIRLDSIAGSGTTAVIIVPQAKAEAAPTPESPADALRM